MSVNIKRVMFVVLFIMVFFAVRIHFYNIPLTGEDGIFAEMMVNQQENPNIQLCGRVDGQNFYKVPSHPIMLYHVLCFGARLSSPLVADVPWQNDAKITPPLRFICSLFQFFIFFYIFKDNYIICIFNCFYAFFVCIYFTGCF